MPASGEGGKSSIRNIKDLPFAPRALLAASDLSSFLLHSQFWF